MGSQMKTTVINKYILLYNSIYSTRFYVIMWHEILYLQNLLIPLFLLFTNKADTGEERFTWTRMIRAPTISNTWYFFSTNSSRSVDCDRKKRFMFRGII